MLFLIRQSLNSCLKKNHELALQQIQRRTMSASPPLPECLVSDHTFIEDSSAPDDYENSAFVYPNVVSESEEEALLVDIKSRMKRRRFERGHWDAVILQYKETELVEHDGSLSHTTLDILTRIRSQLAKTHFVKDPHLVWLPSHAIQLREDGDLKAHVDSVRFSGDLVAGLSLASSCIMRLKPAANEEGEEQDLSKGFVDMLLEPRSLYAITGPSRYLYSHELLGDKDVFAPKNIIVNREDRFSIIFRDAKKDEQ
mmetsp:Transcript_15085/g.19723  ORF Transcript_15085/g.19723 Transcript_15085/m.19723 type:complete len:255 (+) Transcript_15085:117-881(+)